MNIIYRQVENFSTACDMSKKADGAKNLEVCPLTVSDLDSLDFVINRFFVKLFCTNVMDTVKTCQDYFNFELPSSIIEKRRNTFVACCVPVS